MQGSVACVVMNTLELSTGQLEELRKAHRRERNKQAAYKINAIILLGTGWAVEDVATALLCSSNTLRAYVEKYEVGGISALTSTNYSGRSSLLNEDQKEALSHELDAKIYLTSKEIAHYIENEFEVKYTDRGVRDLLNRLGYEYKKPKLVPGDPDEARQVEFAEMYEHFMENKPDGEEVLFVDAVHAQHNTIAAYGWMRKGEQKKIPTNSGRQRINIHGAINIETLDVHVLSQETVNGESTIDLLDLLQQQYPGATKLHVILDNAKYHYSKTVQDWLKDNPCINLVFLPAYSPELNLIERLWRLFKKRVLYNQYIPTYSIFVKKCQEFFRNLRNCKDELRTLMDGGFEGF